MSGGMAWTIRCDSLELCWDLVLHGMGEIVFHVFGKFSRGYFHSLGSPIFFTRLGSLMEFLRTIQK